MTSVTIYGDWKSFNTLPPLASVCCSDDLYLLIRGRLYIGHYHSNEHLYTQYRNSFKSILVWELTDTADNIDRVDRAQTFWQPILGTRITRMEWDR